MNYNPTKNFGKLNINAAVPISDDTTITLDIRLLSAAMHSQCIGQSFSTVVGAAMNVLLNCATKYPDRNVRAGIAVALHNLAVRVNPEVGGWVIEYADGGRWRTMDSLGLPDWTDDSDKALCFRDRGHADLFALDDSEDVRVRTAPAPKPPAPKEGGELPTNTVTE